MAMSKLLYGIVSENIICYMPNYKASHLLAVLLFVMINLHRYVWHFSFCDDHRIIIHQLLHYRLLIVGESTLTLWQKHMP